jgi:hypothetical protein
METLGLSPNENESNHDIHELAAQIKNGASWFYWVAGLSLVNSAISFFNGGWSFFAGLGVTQIIDAIIAESGDSTAFSVVKIIAFFFEIAIAGIFLGLGFFANKPQSWAFIVGIILYFLDGILMLVLGALLPAAFHGFVLFMLIRGFFAVRKLNSISTLSNV